MIEDVPLLTFSCQLPFKGYRNYIHSTDLFTELCTILICYGFDYFNDFDLRFYQPIVGLIEGRLYEKEHLPASARLSSYKVVISFSSDGRHYILLLYELQADHCQRNSGFVESRLFANTHVEIDAGRKLVRFTHTDPAVALIEYAVFGFKHCLESQFGATTQNFRLTSLFLSHVHRQQSAINSFEVIYRNQSKHYHNADLLMDNQPFGVIKAYQP